MKVKEIDVWVTDYAAKRLCGSELIDSKSGHVTLSTVPEHESEVKAKLLIEIPEKKIKLTGSEISNAIKNHIEARTYYKGFELDLSIEGLLKELGF